MILVCKQFVATVDVIVKLNGRDNKQLNAVETIRKNVQMNENTIPAT